MSITVVYNRLIMTIKHLLEDVVALGLLVELGAHDLGGLLLHGGGGGARQGESEDYGLETHRDISIRCIRQSLSVSR